MRKLSQFAKSNFISGFSCLNGAVEVSDMKVSLSAGRFTGNRCSPSLSNLKYSYVTAFVVGVLFTIGSILSMITKAKIALSVIKGLRSIDVVNEFIWRGVKNLSVHGKESEFSIDVLTALCVELLLTPRPVGIPVVLRQPCVVFDIDRSRLPSRKRDQLNRWIVWLDNLMTRHMWLLHGVYCTRKGVFYA